MEAGASARQAPIAVPRPSLHTYWHSGTRRRSAHGRRHGCSSNTVGFRRRRGSRNRCAWLVWQGIREHRGIAFVGAGIAALAAYGFVATRQADGTFGRILAAYGGIFVAGSLAWGMIADGFRPDRYDFIGAAVCLAGVGVIMFAPRLA